MFVIKVYKFQLRHWLLRKLG